MPPAGLLLLPFVLLLQAQLSRQAEVPDAAAQVLLDFANAARGGNTQALPKWQDGTDPCTWTGVTCSGTAVTAIRLQHAGLQGTLTPALAQLASLQQINLSGNELRGQLPPRWARLDHLERLHLDNNALSGTLPAAWNMLASLQYLGLSGNQLNGTLPTAWSSMGRLFLLDLAGNRLSGTLPAPWARHRTLVRLSLARNTLTGGLPREWSSMRSLLQLDLAGNKLRGVLPPEWSALQQVTSVDLSSNTLGGGLPAVWGGLGSLQVLQLQGNQLTGAIPNAWTALADRAYRIGLAGNAQLCGAVAFPLSRALLDAGSSKEGSGLTAPCTWEADAAALLAFKADVTAQQELGVLQDWLPQANPCAAAAWTGVSCKGGRVHSVNLTGAGVKFSSLEHLASLDQLVEVSLSGNNAAGASLPASWAILEHLILADLSGLGLAGTLPPSWAQMGSLEQLLLSGNDLNGTLPAGWSALSKLGSLTVAKNALTGSLPPEWGALTSLSTLDASANYLSGALPEAWTGMAALKDLRLDSNNLGGPIPASWATLPSLSRLGLASNVGVCGGQPVWGKNTAVHTEATNVQQSCMMVNTSGTMAAVVLGVALSLTLLSLAAVGGMFVLLRRQRAELQLIQSERGSGGFLSKSNGGGDGKHTNPRTFCLSADARQAAPAAERFKGLTVSDPWQGEHAGYIQVALSTPHGGLPPPPSIAGGSTTPRSAPPQGEEHRSPSPGSGMPSPERHLWQVAAQAADRGVDLTARRARSRRAQLFRSRSEAPSALNDVSAGQEVDEQGRRQQEAGPAGWSQDDSELDMLRVHSRLALLPSDGGMV